MVPAEVNLQVHQDSLLSLLLQRKFLIRIFCDCSQLLTVNRRSALLHPTTLIASNCDHAWPALKSLSLPIQCLSPIALQLPRSDIAVPSHCFTPASVP